MRLFACILMLGVCVSILEPGTAFGEASTDAPVVAEVKQSDIEVSVLDWRVLGLSSEELSDVADVWQGHLAANLNAISMVATGKIAEGSADRVNAPNLSELLIQNDTILDRYAIVLSAWERKGGSEAEIERHRAFMRGSSAQLLRSIDLLTFLATVFHWVFSWRGGLSLFVQLGITIVGFILILVLARVVRRVVDRRIERKGNVAVLGKVLARNMAFWVTLLFGVLFVLVRNGANLTTIATIVGGLGFLLAVAMQNALGNVASGILIMLFRPFDIGDVVRFGELVGTVEGLETSATLVRKFDNLLVRIPNEEVWKNRVSNFSVPDLLRVELVFNIGFPQDQEKAIAVLLNVAKREPSCRQTPQPEVFVAEVGEASIGIYCRAWVDPADYWSTAWALTAAGVEALHRSGIQIATPFYDVKLHNPTGSVAQIG